ncbi:hypothetical protein E2C01_052167 [Portunus trituberculatus]|uniref:Uncharacterized protein n=1 Tax=Portunus trituberculatus TaxID=210409 RepID=A0A5B7GGU6_PORTR|nr:hypothetical protein [Portunus trituberculatus]
MTSTCVAPRLTAHPTRKCTKGAHLRLDGQTFKQSRRLKALRLDAARASWIRTENGERLFPKWLENDESRCNDPDAASDPRGTQHNHLLRECWTSATASRNVNKYMREEKTALHSKSR